MSGLSVSQWLRRIDRAKFRQAIVHWYRRKGRKLPWRRTTDPYRIWVSEIMLQQTTVATVRERYDSFLERFPSIEILAKATREDVLHAWQGLGYYRRARLLHQAAQVVVATMNGRFPQEPAELQRLPGLGRYTAAALASFAFDARAPILEANTLRLWTRLTASSGDPKRAPLNDQLWTLAETMLPARTSRDFNNALMDLGALVCVPKMPRCGDCPVQRFCQAFDDDVVSLLPQLKPRPEKESVRHLAALIIKGKKVLITQRGGDQTWAGMWELPRVERSPGESVRAAAARAAAIALVAPTADQWNIGRRLATVRHGIMNHNVTLDCYPAATSEPLRLQPSSRWANAADLARLPMSSPQRTLLQQLGDRGALPWGSTRSSICRVRNRNAAP